ncbi:MAG: phosphoribosylformylglycinamidine synthase subunit PurQ [Bdellovibrio sp.]|nr:phosphoribosylformylglycinamidine synthase subunit PurQ [Bdellovibrio sp.]
MSQIPRALVLFGDGINCECETAQALRLVGFDVEIKHLNDLIAERCTNEELAQKYALLVLPGGFSFGDDLTSGKVLALKIRHSLGWNLSFFAERGGLIVGICNGFQALIKLGVFGSEISITMNEQGKFINTWVKVTPRGTKCVWLKGIGTMELPIRHGEGKIIISKVRHQEILNKLDRNQMMCLLYENNPNGSEMNLAGLCDSTGRIFGLMPHPEAFVRWTSHPEWTMTAGRSSAPGQGLAIFENAFQEAIHAK